MPQLSLLKIVGGTIRTDLKCAACALCETKELRSNQMPGTGAYSPTYMIVGFAPGREDDRLGAPMTGANGRLLHRLLREARIDKSDCYITNCLKCCPYEKNVTDTHWKKCQDYLITEINQRKPKVIIAAGAKAMTWLTEQRGISKLRKKGLPCTLPVDYDVMVFPIRQPMSLVHAKDESERQQLHDLLVEDLAFIREQVEQGTLHRGGDIETDYQYASTKDDIDRFFYEFSQHQALSCDLETGDVHFKKQLFPGQNSKIISIGFSYGKGVGRAIPLYARGITTPFWWPDGFVEEYINPRLQEIFRTKTVWGQNFVSFDQKWIRRHLKIDYCKIDFDTMLAHYLLDEERGGHGLEQQALIGTSMTPWKKEFTLEDTVQMCRYLCKDVDAGYRLRQVWEPQLNPLQLWLLRELLIPLGNILMDVEYRGVRIQTDNLNRMDEYFRRRISEEISDLKKHPAVRAFELSKNSEFSPDSAPQVAELMEHFLKLKAVKRTEGGKYSTDKEVLDHYGSHPVVSSIKTVRQLRKLHSTYCVNFAEKSAEDGRIHTTYNLHGTVTGRPSSENPNLMNIPREGTAAKVMEDSKAIKGAFAASENCCILQADYSQIELRVLACMSGDKVMSETFHRGQDAHAATAAALYGVPIEKVTKEQRNAGKIPNFGIPYGMSEESLIRDFVAAGNTEEEAKTFMRRHRETYTGVWKYMAKQEEIVRTIGYQETPFGRRRRYAEVGNRELRQAYNFPIQSIASDLTELSIIRCVRAMKELGLNAKFLMTVYDSIMFDVPIKEFWQTATLVKTIMEGMKFDWLTVPIVADLEAGPDWGHLRKVDVVSKTIG